MRFQGLRLHFFVFYLPPSPKTSPAFQFVEPSSRPLRLLYEGSTFQALTVTLYLFLRLLHVALRQLLEPLASGFPS